MEPPSARLSGDAPASSTKVAVGGGARGRGEGGGLETGAATGGGGGGGGGGEAARGGEVPSAEIAERSTAEGESCGVGGGHDEDVVLTVHSKVGLNLLSRCCIWASSVPPLEASGKLKTRDTASASCPAPTH